MLNVYGKKHCSRCKQVTSLLEKRGIEYQYYDIFEVNTEYYTHLLMKYNKGIYPLIMKDDEVMTLSDVLKQG